MSNSNEFCENGQAMEVQEVINWRLELEGGSDLKDLAMVLQEKRDSTNVDVCVHDTLAEKPEMQVISLFEKLSCTLHGLRKLEFYPGTGSYNAFPIEALSAAVRESRGLESLYVYHLNLQGNPRKFQEFANNLEECKLLKEVCFIDCRMSSDQADDNLSFDPIVRSLGRLECLEVVALWADDLGALTTESLTEVCRSSSIERLMILGFNLTEKEVCSMFHKLERNQTLRRMNISCSMGARGCESLSRMLHSNSNLEKLKIELDALEDENDLVGVAEGLKGNQTLNYFKLSGQGSESESRGLVEAFESMLECNLSLQSLSLLDGCLHSPVIDLYLKLNIIGRTAVLKGKTAAREPWVEALANSNGDMDCLFYFLSSNPALLR